MNFGQDTQNMIIEWLRGNSTAVPTALDVALSTADPKADGSGLNEPPAPDGYSRQTLVLAAGSFDVDAGTTTNNTGNLVFGAAVNNDWPSVSHLAIFDNGTGDILAFGALAAQRTVVVGDTYTMAIGSLQFLVR